MSSVDFPRRCAENYYLVIDFLFFVPPVLRKRVKSPDKQSMRRKGQSAISTDLDFGVRSSRKCCGMRDEQAGNAKKQ